MKLKFKVSLIIILFIIGLGLFVWGKSIMMNYEGYREIFESARKEAYPQYISGLIILVICYVLTFYKK